MEQQYRMFETPECFNCNMEYSKHIKLQISDVIIKVCDECITIYEKYDPFADIMILNRPILYYLNNMI